MPYQSPAVITVDRIKQRKGLVALTTLAALMLYGSWTFVWDGMTHVGPGLWRYGGETTHEYWAQISEHKYKRECYEHAVGLLLLSGAIFWGVLDKWKQRNKLDSWEQTVPTPPVVQTPRPEDAPKSLSVEDEKRQLILTTQEREPAPHNTDRLDELRPHDWTACPPAKTLAPTIPRGRRVGLGTVAVCFGVVALVCGGVWGSFRNSQDAREQRHATEIRMAALALRYNPVTNWMAALPGGDYGMQLSALEVSRALIRSNQQPVLIRECYLDDVVEKDGTITASLSSMEAGVVNFLALELQCSPDQVKAFTGSKCLSKNRRTRSFAVIARYHEVQRLAGEVGEFLARGELLDAVKLP